MKTNNKLAIAAAAGLTVLAPAQEAQAHGRAAAGLIGFGVGTIVGSALSQPRTVIYEPQQTVVQTLPPSVEYVPQQVAGQQVIYTQSPTVGYVQQAPVQQIITTPTTTTVVPQSTTVIIDEPAYYYGGYWGGYRGRGYYGRPFGGYRHHGSRPMYHYRHHHHGSGGRHCR